MRLLLANPRGFCAGVDRAVEIVERALEIIGPPIYVRHEVVHNTFVVNGLKEKGAIFIESLSEVPDGATLIFSAHGVSQAVRNEAAQRQLKIFDATCPLVTKVHMEVARYDRRGMECILIGHAGHPEVEGTLGQYHNADGGIYLVERLEDVDKLTLKDAEQVAYVTQTTLSLDDTSKIIDRLKEKFPAIKGPEKADICYATQNRQDAVKQLASQVQVMLVVGSEASSNSNRLRELAERMGCSAYLIEGASHLKREWFDNVEAVGITAGASAPEVLVNAVVTRLVEWGARPPTEVKGVEESMSFALPKELRTSL